MSSAYALTSSRLGVVGRRRAPTPPLWLHPPRCAAGPPQDNGYVTPMCHPMPPTHHHGISMATATHHRSSCPCCLQHLQDYTGNIFSPIRVPRRGGKKFISNILTFIICLIKLIVCIINV